VGEGVRGCEGGCEMPPAPCLLSSSRSNVFYLCSLFVLFYYQYIIVFILF
jgi:hypothetical protein